MNNHFFSISFYIGVTSISPLVVFPLGVGELVCGDVGATGSVYDGAMFVRPFSTGDGGC